MNLLTRSSAVVTVLFLAGCSQSWTDAELNGGSVQPAAVQTAPSDVVLTSANTISGHSLSELGALEVHVNKTTAFHPAPTKEAVEAALQSEAAKLGADAVIGVAIEGPYVSAFSWGTMKGTGVAVTYD